MRYSLYSKTTGKEVPVQIIKKLVSDCGHEQVLFRPKQTLLLGDSLAFLMSFDTLSTNFKRENDDLKASIRRYMDNKRNSYYFKLHYAMKVQKEADIDFKPLHLSPEIEYRADAFSSSAGFHNEVAIQLFSDDDPKQPSSTVNLVEVTIDSKTFYYPRYLWNIFVLHSCGVCGGGGHKLVPNTEYTADVRLLKWSGQHSESCKISFRTGVFYDAWNGETYEASSTQSLLFQQFLTTGQ
ncbi:MAG: hypothetical protein RLZZ292_3802 [Bacteroidota bacterium]|jgi:hypothetical protein